MFSLKLVNFSLLLFYVFVYSKAHSTSKKKIYQLDKLLKYPGWKNLNDTSYIKYCNKSYYLNNLIETPTRTIHGESKIRALTLFLGCSYAKVMINIFSIIVNWQEICKNKNKEDHDLLNGCIYTKELINVIAKLIVPIAILLKNAMDALDSLHHFPSANFKIYQQKPYMIRVLLNKIGNILDQLNDPILLILSGLQYETHAYCEFVPYDTNYLWNEWVEEYKIINQREMLIFFKFLTRKMNYYIKTVIIEMYFQLGFKFDPITEETFIPTPEELIELELEFKATDEEPPRLVHIENYQM
ncbi:uncharacterized protein LOC126907394 isoform X2 [Daktulosphaira vitifoliae]|uniref:uncharacterized protein LOC126907394 isoform X2 n=1 Tax=Daktulosphaira vitifoliae TaxID=58002 RepID=UPI0021A9BCFB|nr:uncharacterized protein LOC126907394 isoform X2 [Daktulosphaira vitifoliae]